MTWVCLDLFSGLGGFSAAFRDSGRWDVTTVEIEEKFDPDVVADVMDLRPSDLLGILGEYDYLVIVASPPCTVFSPAGNHDLWDMDAKEPTAPKSGTRRTRPPCQRFDSSTRSRLLVR